MLPILLALAIQVAPGDSITLEAALARARPARPRAVSAEAGVDRARGQSRVLTTIPSPTVQLEQTDVAPTYRVTATQPLSWLLQRPAARAEGRAGIELARADSAQLMAELAREVRHTFYGALAAAEQLSLVREQAALADSLVRLAELRVHTGDISRLERDQLAQEALLARQAVSRAQEQERIARVLFARAIGWSGSDAPRPSGRLDEGLEGELAVEQTTPAASGAKGAGVPKGVGMTKGAESPALRAALADSAAAAARLRRSQWARLPVPGVLAKHESGGGTGGQLYFGISLPVPLWSLGNGAVAEARAAAREVAANTAETRLTFEAQLAEVGVRLEEAAARARLARGALLPSARHLREATLKLYREGQVGILPVFEALRGERNIALTTVADLMAFQDARADLLALLGRWE